MYGCTDERQTNYPKLYHIQLSRPTIPPLTVKVPLSKLAPLTMAQIEAIFSSPAASGDMVSQHQVTLVEGIGLEGDRYALRRGTYSCLQASQHRPGKAEPGRQLTLISGDGVREALQQYNVDWTTKSLGDFRRNVVLQGISAAELLATVGCVLEFGTEAAKASDGGDDGKVGDQDGNDGPRLLVHRNCVPCMYNERKNGIPGMMEALWDAGGVSCEVLRGGSIAVGDTLRVVSQPQSMNTSGIVDPGHQSSGFFVRPSKRSTAMILEGLQHQKKTHAVLVASDPEGVERAAASYASVGLTFWPKSQK